ncbi:MAG: beta-ketoacyl-ACP synthase, partial [Myxococcaceae bacterium]|nr:beta-ketoacyl-ACP synthase [Myxococcaceae bacterium]
MNRVVVTGVGAFSPIGHDWPTVFARLKAQKNAVVVVPSLAEYEGLTTHLGAPAAPFELDESKWNRKTTRSMGRVALLAVLATEKALAQAGLLDDPWIRS